MKIKYYIPGALMILIAISLNGCGGSSGSSNSPQNPQDPPVQTNSDIDEQVQPDLDINISPSLGKFYNATVKLFEADTTSLLASYEIASNGEVSINYSGSYEGALVVAVLGDDDATYYDEAAGTELAFGPGNSLHAIVPSGTTKTALSLLTEVAYQLAITNDIPLTDNSVASLNEKVRLALSPELSSIITPPLLFDSSTTSGSLGDDDAGRYALLLAALAQLGASDGTPALSIAKQLSLDLSDGVLDGESKDGVIPGLLYSVANFESDLTGHLTTVASSFASSALQTAVTAYDPVSTTIDITDLLSGELIPVGDGAALGEENGITGTLGTTTYTYSDYIGDESLFLYAFATDTGVITAYNSSEDPLTRWIISGFPASVGSYNCGESSEVPLITLTLSSVVHVATSCVIDVISVSTTEVEGRFAAEFSGLGTLTDGYFIYQEPAASTGGLQEGEFGYSMDVDGSNVTDNEVPALDGFDRQVADFLTLGDTPTMNINMIPEGLSGSYTCGQGPNSFRLVNMSYQGFSANNETYPGSCSVDVTYTDGIYTGTFSGTLYNSTGEQMLITNGFVRNDGREL